MQKSRIVVISVMSEERLTRLACGCRRFIMHGLLLRNLLLLYRSTPTPPGPLCAMIA